MIGIVGEYESKTYYVKCNKCKKTLSFQKGDETVKIRRIFSGGGFDPKKPYKILNYSFAEQNGKIFIKQTQNVPYIKCPSCGELNEVSFD